jgi:Zinc knuckle
MDLDAAQIDALAAEEKAKLQKEGRCYTCKKLGHISHVCPNKPNKKDGGAATQGGKFAVRNIEPENGDAKGTREAMAEEIKAMSVEE